MTIAWYKCRLESGDVEREQDRTIAYSNEAVGAHQDDGTSPASKDTTKASDRVAAR